MRGIGHREVETRKGDQPCDQPHGGWRGYWPEWTEILHNGFVQRKRCIVIVAIGGTSRIVGASTSLEIGKIGQRAACLRKNVTQVLLRTEQH